MKKSLKKYNLLSASILAALSSSADVIYTDVDPDLSYNQNGDEYQLDLNNDGTVDYTISNYSFQYGFPGFFSINGYQVNITPASGNGVFGISTISTFSTSYGGTSYSSNFQASPLRVNEKISSNGSFTASETLLAGNFNGSFFGSAFSTNYGNFNDTIFDRFIGLEFKEGNKTLYGWARISAKAEKGSQEFTVFDYAYEDSGSPIYAGHGIVSPGSLSIEKGLTTIPKVYFVNNNIKIESEITLNGEINVFTVDGKQIISTKINGENAELNGLFEQNKQYVISLNTEEGNYSTRIFNSNF